jgi:hypothetical protein
MFRPRGNVPARAATGPLVYRDEFADVAADFDHGEGGEVYIIRVHQGGPGGRIVAELPVTCCEGGGVPSARGGQHMDASYRSGGEPLGDRAIESRHDSLPHGNEHRPGSPGISKFFPSDRLTLVMVGAMIVWKIIGASILGEASIPAFPAGWARSLGIYCANIVACFVPLVSLGVLVLAACERRTGLVIGAVVGLVAPLWLVIALSPVGDPPVADVAQAVCAIAFYVALVPSIVAGAAAAVVRTAGLRDVASVKGKSSGGDKVAKSSQDGSFGNFLGHGKMVVVGATLVWSGWFAAVPTANAIGTIIGAIVRVAVYVIGTIYAIAVNTPSFLAEHVHWFCGTANFYVVLVSVAVGVTIAVVRAAGRPTSMPSHPLYEPELDAPAG